MFWSIQSAEGDNLSQFGVTIRAERCVEAEYLWTLVLDDDGVPVFVDRSRVAPAVSPCCLS